MPLFRRDRDSRAWDLSLEIGPWLEERVQAKQPRTNADVEVAAKEFIDYSLALAKKKRERDSYVVTKAISLNAAAAYAPWRGGVGFMGHLRADVAQKAVDLLIAQGAENSEPAKVRELKAQALQMMEDDRNAREQDS